MEENWSYFHIFLLTAIVKEKTEQELINSISDFKMDALKPTETVEKLILPTKDGKLSREATLQLILKRVFFFFFPTTLKCHATLLD